MIRCVKCGGEIPPLPYPQCEVPGRVHFDYADCVQWTTDLPTEPGWYWASNGVGDLAPVQIASDNGVLIVWDEVPVPLSERRGGFWMRIETPDLPETA